MQTLGLSSSTPKSSNWLRELLWPAINDDVSALTAARNGMYICFFVALITAVMALLTNRLALVDAALFLMVGVGIRQFSRVAAMAGLVLYVMSIVARDAGPVRRAGHSGDHFHGGARECGASRVLCAPLETRTGGGGRSSESSNERRR